MINQVLLLFFLFIVYGLTDCQAASAHIHQHKTATGNKERIEDGAFSPRDNKHYSEGNEHNSEFDHEAILGKFFVFYNFNFKTNKIIFTGLNLL